MAEESGEKRDLDESMKEDGDKKKDPAKDKNAPKRNQSAYMLWRGGVGWSQAKEAGQAGTSAISKWCDAKWKEMGAEEKAAWEVKASADKVRYEAQVAAYKAKAAVTAQETTGEDVEITGERTRTDIVDAHNAAGFDANQNPNLVDLTATDCFFAKHQNCGEECSAEDVDPKLADEQLSLGIAHVEALAAIRAEQRDGGSVPLYPYLDFARLVRAIGSKYNSEIRYEERAIAILYAALEAYVIDLLKDANSVACNSMHAPALQPEDFKLARWIRDGHTFSGRV